jgi:carboxyl-terminal processing protease
MKRLISASILVLSCSMSTFAQATKAEIPLLERAWVATQIYSFIRSSFAHWRALPEFDFDAAYRDYLRQILATSDRRDFDLLTMAFIAQLKNGHSGFGDQWLRDNFGQRIGFFAIPIDGTWVVTRSENPELKIGDVVLRVDGDPIERFYARNRRYLSASDERWARRSLFENPYLFPAAFDVELEGGRHVHVVRKGPFRWAGTEESSIRAHDEQGVLYVRIPSFANPALENDAVIAVKKHITAKAIIIDVRGNHGGSTPARLVAALMDRPYTYYAESTPVGLPLFRYTGQVDENPEIYWDAGTQQPEADAYRGSVYVLVDGGCFSACEDFLVSFKTTKRATLIGEASAGSSGQPIGMALWDGMAIGVSAKREYFPGGVTFEGRGVAPDISVHTTAADLRNGRDPVLEKARELIGR